MRLDRLLALTVYLLNRDRVTAGELARHFEISPRTVHRDLEAINQAGIPVVAYQGRGGGFGIMESYRLDRQVLTRSEMGAMLTALKGVCRAVDDRRMDGLIDKIETLIPRGERAAARARERVLIDVNPWAGRRSDREKIRLINQAMDLGRLLSFGYTNAKGEISARLVEPMAIMLKENHLYLFGFCRMRGAHRLFRLSRMSAVRICDESFQRREMNLDDWSWQFWASDHTLRIEVELRFAAAARVRVLDLFEPEQISAGEDGRLLVKGVFSDDEWLYRMILSHGDEVEVISPSTLRERIRERAAAILRLYGGS